MKKKSDSPFIFNVLETDQNDLLRLSHLSVHLSQWNILQF